MSVACLVIGMAGSGKTTLMQRLMVASEERGRERYVINLDPAVGMDEEEGIDDLPYESDLDIRDAVNYKQVMQANGLGPNGGILTCLNLFATQFDSVISIMQQRASAVDYFFVDTPGQIEVFTWSASGSIVTEAIASLMPTVILFVVDTPRSSSPATFCSNMLYACSVMFRTKLPMILVFNKVDVRSHDFAKEWMGDFEKFQDALDDERVNGADYMSSLTKSMALVLDEFYQTLAAVGVSAATGQGMTELFAAIDAAAEEYKTTYLEDLNAKRAAQARKDATAQQASMARLRQDRARVDG